MQKLNNIPYLVKIIFFLILNSFVFIGIILIIFSYPSIEKINEFKIDKIKNDSIYLLSSYSLKNDNVFSLKAKNISYTIYYNNQSLGRGKVSEDLFIKKKSTSNVNTKSTLSLKQVSVIWNQINQKDTIGFDINFNGQFSPLNLHLDANHELNIPIRELLFNFLKQNAFKIDKIKIRKMNFNEMHFDFGITIQNPLPADLKIKKLKFELFDSEIMKKSLGNWNLNENVKISNNQSKILEGELKIKNKDLMSKIISSARKIDMIINTRAHIHFEINDNLFETELPSQISINPITKKIIILN